MKDIQFQLNLSLEDAVIGKGELSFVHKVTEDTVTLLAKQAGSVPLTFTHEELAKLLEDGHFSIEYGYFSDRQAARRARAGRALLSRLSLKTQLLAFQGEAWCEAMREGEEEGWFNRSSKRWFEFLPKLHERVKQKLQDGVLKAMNGEPVPPDLLSHVPGRSTIMQKYRVWEETRDPMIFVKRSIFNGQNGKRVHPHVEAIIQIELANYLHPNEIYPSQVLDAVNSEVRRKNIALGIAGEELLPEVSLSTIERRINELDRFEVLAARKGVAYAKNKLGAHVGGIKLQAPLFRIEMDEWEIDLMSILKSAGIDITHTSLRDLELGRYWVCVAMDTASRSILGLKLSTAPSAEDAKAVIWMAMRDKTALASGLGCETPWSQHGHVYHVVVDNGPAFVNADFKAVLSDLAIDYSVLPAGVPRLRGVIERLFRTIATLLMPYLTGRTFSNPQQRGDYPSEKYAVHTAESILELLVRFTVDVYHNRKHRSLEYATPNNMWDKLVSEFGWSPPMSAHKLRHILGLKFQRKTGPHGILMNGVNYHSKRLAKHFLKYGPQSVEVSIDPEDMGHISVWLERGNDSGWSTLRATIDGLDGISFATWERSVFELRKNNRAAASLTQGVLDRAIQRMKEIDAEQCAARQLGPIKTTRDQIKRAQKETFWGLSLGSDPDVVADKNAPSPDQDIGFLSDEIPYLPGPLPEEEPILPEESESEWLFSDELDDDDGDRRGSDETEEKGDE
ncbi:DDE-type integrase/transposase/recombinase [Ruegeria arenilitoris]|uniref:DDE-type integrase/transposase/recombinase n=1 Tax=Ruegeria arenilitoris TaxID=1173585 RepID=UPI00147F13AD|nr:DDE-type integrase/transposase/recombinase [Ruegeria arenilitoris]